MINLLATIFTVFGTISLAAFSFLNNRRSATTILFSVLTVAFAGVSLSNYLAVQSVDPSIAIFWVRFNMVCASIVISMVFIFIHTYPGEHIRLPRKIFYPALIWMGILAILSSTPLVFEKAVISAKGLNPVPGPGIALFALSLVINIGLGFFFLIKKYRSSTGILRNQIQFLIFGLVSTVVVLSFTNFVLVLILKDTSLTNVGISSILIFVGATTYAIVKHRLLDIRLVVARAVAYALLVTIIATFFTGSTVLITSLLLKQSTNIEQILIYAVLTLIVAFVFQPLRNFFEKVTDKIFFKQDYDFNGLLSSLTKVMAEKILIDDIAHSLLTKIIEEIRITRGAFVLTDGGKIFVSETQGYKEEPKFSEKDVFSIQALDKNLVFEEVEEGPAKELMRKLDVTIVIPLKTQVDHVGILLLGEKASGEIYSAKDIKVLEIFSPEAAISFENAKSVEKIRRFNITLKEQVERATHELKNANEQLKSLDKLKDEFLSIASHDLRTPMTAIRSYLWMVLNGRAGEIKNPTMKRYLDITYSSSERMIALINDLLNVSRIEAGRVEMNFEEAALKPIVDQVFAEIMSKASEKAIELKYDGVPKLPLVVIDKQRFPEILQNLVGNAIKFTKEKGTITISAKPSEERGFVEISVKDNGVGLSKEDQEKLFRKYGRLDSSYTAAASSGGTGLGLYITKNYVELHGGRIWVESEIGKGTTFKFTLHAAGPNTIRELISVTETKQTIPVIPSVKTPLKV